MEDIRSITFIENVPYLRSLAHFIKDLYFKSKGLAKMKLTIAIFLVIVGLVIQNTCSRYLLVQVEGKDPGEK